MDDNPPTFATSVYHVAISPNLPSISTTPSCLVMPHKDDIALSRIGTEEKEQSSVITEIVTVSFC